MTDLDTPLEDLTCHCGDFNMWLDEPEGNEFSNGLMYYCRPCATSRCDTSDGMLEGCPNGCARCGSFTKQDYCHTCKIDQVTTGSS